MNAMLILVAFVGFTFGGLGLMLLLGYLNIEEQRSEEREREALEMQMKRALEQWPRFLVQPDGKVIAAPHGQAAEHLLANLEGYLKSERDMVAHFVSDPTVDNLYRQPQQNLPVN